ncbi:endo-arabinanase [Blastomyces gilchristii SLH14081]|uniref:Endo-arabinanase n=1 Tax=Blastomyces gilchristii (strain SLH14081) TaxID=559298 RepID=A0A179UAF5_BLAGS|nr:endo-arabinanase [Blastomyces gilchristii SLH14081]OAT04830.1 endo-arabinanase [Blastomyces gilchristii SLH14081]
MVLLLHFLVAGVSLCAGLAGAAAPPEMNKYPRSNNANIYAHDPNIIKDDMGHLLEGDSIIPNKKNATRPWAPSVIKRGDTLYCYYTLSGRGKRDSAIGVATTKKLARGAYWKDHGALIQTETGEGFDVFPFTTSNAIDASVSIDGGKAYLNYGSFFSGIWQVPLGKDLKCLPNSRKLNAVQLARKRQKRNDIEGSFMSFHGGWYYLWFSRGIEAKTVPAENKLKARYSIRGGGHKVYASNYDNTVFAPGGLGVLTGMNGTPDILYYHYFNAKVSLKHEKARVGYNTLKYVNGWPVVQAPKK